MASLEFEQAFLDWLVQRIADALTTEQAAPVTNETVLSPRTNGVWTTHGFRWRNSNAFRRPFENQPTLVIDGETWILGDDPRGYSVLMPRPDATPVPRRIYLPPPPFGSLATMNELMDFFEEWDDGNQWKYTTVFSKGLAADSDSGVADFPVDDDIREKLWRERNKRGTIGIDWGEWDMLTREWPSEQHPYQSGRDNAGVYLAGIARQDWRYLKVTDIMPLFVDDDGKLWVPDNRQVWEWYFNNGTISQTLRFNPPTILVNDGGGFVNRAPYSQQSFLMYSVETYEMMGEPSIVQQPVKHYYRDGTATTVRQADYEKREHAFDASGSDSMDVDGTFTLDAGDTLNMNGMPNNWWHVPLFVGAVVVGNHTSTNEIHVSFSGTDLRDYLIDNEVAVRFTDGLNIYGPATVVDVEDRSGSWYLILNIPLPSVPNGAAVQRYSIAIPKSGSRTYYVHDEASFSWQQFTLVQVSLFGGNFTYRVRPAVETTISRRIRLYEGTDSAGTLLHDDGITDETTYGTGNMGSDAEDYWFREGGISSGGPNSILSGAGDDISFNPGEATTDELDGDLPECTFLRAFGGVIPGTGSRQYRFDGTVVTMNLAPIPEDPNAGIQTSDYQFIPPWEWTQYWDEPWFQWNGLVNPRIYNGEHGHLHNPTAHDASLGSQWFGLSWNERWYAADALIGPNGELIGVALLDDSNKTLLVSVDGEQVWSGSAFTLLCGGDHFDVTYPGPDGPSTWPPPTPRNTIYAVAPHYNFLHPNWPFPMAMVGPFAVRAAGVEDPGWTAPVKLHPIF